MCKWQYDASAHPHFAAPGRGCAGCVPPDAARCRAKPRGAAPRRAIHLVAPLHVLLSNIYVFLIDFAALQARVLNSQLRCQAGLCLALPRCRARRKGWRCEVRPWSPA